MTAGELAQLIEKEHSVMGERDLAGDKDAVASSHQRRQAGGVVGASVRPVSGRWPVQTCRRPDTRNLDCFVLGDIGKDSRETSGQHGLARPRRSEQE